MSTRLQGQITSSRAAHILKTLRTPFFFAATYGVRPFSTFTQELVLNHSLQSEVDTWLVGIKAVTSPRNIRRRGSPPEDVSCTFLLRCQVRRPAPLIFHARVGSSCDRFQSVRLGFLVFCNFRYSMLFACLFVLTRETRGYIDSGSLKPEALAIPPSITNCDLQSPMFTKRFECSDFRRSQ
jgi:hypothetical protein